MSKTVTTIAILVHDAKNHNLVSTLTPASLLYPSLQLSMLTVFAVVIRIVASVFACNVYRQTVVLILLKSSTICTRRARVPVLLFYTSHDPPRVKMSRIFKKLTKCCC